MMSASTESTLDPEINGASAGALRLDDVVVIEVLFHPDLRRVGDRFVLGAALGQQARSELVIGRDSPVFRAGGWGEGRSLGDPCVSRKQATLRWSPETQRFEIQQAAEARRNLSIFAQDGSLLGQAPGAFPAGSTLGIGDRILLLCDCRPVEVTGSDLGMVGDSRAMVTLRSQIRTVADSNDTVLVTGETGVGKELVARAIHDASRRRKGPFLVVNCAAMPEALLESELFGHAKGAFSGAQAQKDGLFRAAQGGTLFLDEIGELPLGMQSKLLRVLQERAVRPVGEAHERPVDVRVVAATNRDLSAEVEAGRFRADLYSRLEAPVVRVPALRQRREDIARLFVHFLSRRIAADEASHPGEVSPLAWMVRDPGAQPPPVPMDFVLRLISRRWPRNVRELEKTVAALALANRRVGEFVSPLVDEPPLSEPTRPAADERKEPEPPAEPRNISEADLMRELEAHDHIQHRVARSLGISRTTLDKWLRELGINRPKDVSKEAIEQAWIASGYDIERTAKELKVSVRGLKLRMTELNIGDARRSG